MHRFFGGLKDFVVAGRLLVEEDGERGVVFVGFLPYACVKGGGRISQVLLNGQGVTLSRVVVIRQGPFLSPKIVENKPKVAAIHDQGVCTYQDRP